MKCRFRRLMAFILVMVMVGSFTVSASAAATLSNINDVAALPGTVDPLGVMEATLYEDGREIPVYCVVCEGLDFTSVDPNNPRSLYNVVKIGLSIECNKYVRDVISAVKAEVPKGSNLVFYGRSMGGMVIQQVIAQPEIKSNYNVLYTVSVGSPYIYTLRSKEGVLRRMVDITDPVPFMSIAGITYPYKGNVALENSGIHPLVHFYGYTGGKCWTAYDCLGVKGGSSYMVIE